MHVGKLCSKRKCQNLFAVIFQLINQKKEKKETSLWKMHKHHKNVLEEKGEIMGSRKNYIKKTKKLGITSPCLLMGDWEASQSTSRRYCPHHAHLKLASASFFITHRLFSFLPLPFRPPQPLRFIILCNHCIQHLFHPTWEECMQRLHIILSY